MTDLQISLVVVGAAAVAGVWGFNKFQEYRLRRTAEALLKPTTPDVLLNEQPAAQQRGAIPAPVRVEPSLEVPPADRIEPVIPAPIPQGEFDAVGAADTPAWDTEVLPVTAQSIPEAPDASTPTASADLPSLGRREPPPALMSPRIDFIAAFDMVEDVSGESLVQVSRDLGTRLGRRVVCAGWSDVSEAWQICTPEGAYRQLRAAVQLADRSGPITDGQLGLFRDAMQQLADEFLAVADMPSSRSALETAQKLDTMCAGVDIQVGVNVICGAQPFQGTKLRALIESSGLVADRDGTFVRCDDDGRLLFRLLNHDPAGFSPESLRVQTVRGITFLLDVPRVPRGDRVFNQMVELASRFAEALGGALVDDNRRPITEQFLSPIRTQIIQYQGVLATNSIPAGGDLALRLFS